PVERWRAGIEHVRHADEDKLRQAFLWRDLRTPDKAGVFSLHTVKYQVGPDLAGRRVEVRYDPEALFEVEVWRNGRFCERVRPFELHAARRPRAGQAVEASVDTPEPAADWLGHLVARHREQAPQEPDPRAWTHEARARRDEASLALLDLLTD